MLTLAICATSGHSGPVRDLALWSIGGVDQFRPAVAQKSLGRSLARVRPTRTIPTFSHHFPFGTLATRYSERYRFLPIALVARWTAPAPGSATDIMETDRRNARSATLCQIQTYAATDEQPQQVGHVRLRYQPAF
jgi:hypothetical protein